MVGDNAMLESQAVRAAIWRDIASGQRGRRAQARGTIIAVQPAVSGLCFLIDMIG